MSAPRFLLHLEGAVVLAAASWAYAMWGLGWGWFALLMLFGLLPALWGLPLIWIAHLGADRMLGFGLKYPTAFRDTHLARV